MTPAQLKAARKLLGWSQVRLGSQSDTSATIISSFERSGRYSQRRPPLAGIDSISAIRAALEAAGVEFIEQNGDGPGVRLRDEAPTP